MAEEDGGNKRVMPLPRKYVVCREVWDDLEYARLLKQACEEATGEEFAILVLEADKGGRWLTLKEIED